MFLNQTKCCFPFCKLIITLVFLFSVNKVFAIEEPYVNELKGTQVAAGNIFTVADEKFGNSTAWSSIYQNISVNDLISFEINFDTSIHFYNRPFSCTVNFKIYIYGNTADSSQVTDSTTYSNIALEVKYDTVSGKPYKGIALYKFTGAHKFKVRIISINSQQLNPIPAIFRIKGQVIVNREYRFQDASTDVTHFSIVNNNQLKLEWVPSAYPGAEMFDIEYTHIDDSSSIANTIRNNFNSGANLYTVPADTLSLWFKNNSTRITTTGSSYLIDVPYNSGFILFRIRGALIHFADGVRWEGNWNYSAIISGSNCSSGCPSGVVHINDHEPSLNWQYSVVFAEEGKRKEVMSYFSGSLHNRQSVTISNTENKSIVQETIYDILGRPALNILPVPADDSTIHYYRNFNRNMGGSPYSFANYSSDTSGCTTNAQPLSDASGASQYYSANNPFLNKYYFTKYIPKAENYPFSVTEYMADNTGRIAMQGGVGPNFQINSGHETKYFYGKPSQTELDRMFGVEAGNASHYLKNMVIDPNGQISVSYIEPGGKTIATALAGAVPANMHALPSSNGASTQVSDDLMQPEDFTRNSSDYRMSASATFLAPVTGTYMLNYKVDPLKLYILYGPNKDSIICNTCYYDLNIIVKDNCNNTIKEENKPAGFVFDTACSSGAGSVQGTIGVDIAKVGEYYVTYSLKVSKDALNYYDSVHLVKNSDILKFNSFLLDELKQTDFTGCYNNCQTCLDDLGTKDEFFNKFKLLYSTDSVYFGVEDSLYTLSLYDSLLTHCQSIQADCGKSVCDEKLDMLKMDVTPGGQYALYDSSSFQLQELPINVLAKRDSIQFFPDGFGGRDSVMLKNIEGEDSLKVDVKDLSDSLFIANWKDVWADSLVRLHPEYCHYLWCIANSNSYEFDKEIENWTDADTAMLKGWFDPNNYSSVLDHDPFFTGSGLGLGLYNKMKDSLRLFSRTVLRLSQSDKNILQFVDITLYCKGQYNGWDQCEPDSACRSRNREWFLYKGLYLNLKQKFYEEARRTSSDPVFANCVNCHIGKDLLSQVSSQFNDSTYTPFTDSTNCDYHCPGGVYNPYDRNNISLYIEYGSPNTPPANVPSGYSNCRFYAVFDVKTDAASSCKFFNVWVCTGCRTDSCFFNTKQKIFIGLGNQNITDLKQTSDGGFIMSGGITVSGNPNAVFTKLDQNGNVVWSKSIGNAGEEFISRVVQTSDGGYAGIGYTTEYRSLGDPILVKLNSSGDLQWTKTYRSTSANGDRPYGLIQTSDGGYAISGIFENTAGLADQMVLKTSASGQFQWGRTFNGGNSDAASSVLQDGDTLTVLGYFYGTSRYDGSVIKLNLATGALYSTRKYDASDRTNWFGGNSFLMGGRYITQSFNSDDWGGLNGQLSVVSINKDGSVSSFYQVNPSILQNGAAVFCATSDGGTLLSQSESATGSDVYLYKLSASGSIQWKERFPLAGTQLVQRVIETSDGGYAFIASSDSASNGNRQLYFVRTDKLGRTAGCSQDSVTATIANITYSQSAYTWSSINNLTPTETNTTFAVSNLSFTESLRCNGSTCASGGCTYSDSSALSGYASQCAASGSDTLYKDKIRRYPEYVNTADFINSALSGNPQQNSKTQEQQIINECYSNCEAQADYWISALKKCTLDSAKLAQLRLALIDVCSRGCSQNSMYGASTVGYYQKIEAENWSNMSGVQTETTQDFGGGLDVGWFDNGDWVDYNVNVPSPGTYALNFRLASGYVFQLFQVKNAAGDVLAVVNVPFTGNWQHFESISVNVNFPQGQQKLRLESINNGGWNINWVEIKSNPPAYQPIPARIEAENYDAMYGIERETTSDVEGGVMNTAWIHTGDWMDYKINAPATGTYNVKLRIANPNYLEQLQIKDQNGIVLATVPITATGGYQVYNTFETTINLTAGIQTIRVQSNTDGWNFNWMELHYDTLPLQPASYFSFQEAIRGILGDNAINDSCTAELLSNPYPYDKQPFFEERTITETNYEICEKITQYKKEWQASGIGGSFHSYLVRKLGAAYDLDSTELDDLVNSCTRCNGLLKNDVVLPIAFEPGSHPCLVCSDIQEATAVFYGQYPGLDSTKENYEIIFTNFMNHRFGFSLSYDEYKAFIDNCATTRIQAENYTGMSGIQTENTADPDGGGLNVGWIDAGDWMDYSVTTPSAGTYTMSFRIASPTGAQLQVKNSSGTVLATVNLPATGAYQSWQTITASITLPAGTQTLRIYSVTSGWNFNWFATTLSLPETGLTPTLCDHVAQQEYTTDAANDCTAELFANALTNAQNSYIVYIDSVHKEFRNAYMTKCMNVQPALTMSAELYEYHYTLYYYDQSGNLVKTVPPEGVQLLSEQQLADVQLYRKLQNGGCYQYSDSIRFNNDGYVNFYSPAYDNTQPFTIEARLNLASHSDQVILSHVSEETDYNTSQLFHVGYILSLVNNKLKLELYNHSDNGVSDTSIALSSLDIGQLLPQNSWRHLALEFTADTLRPWKLFINGNEVALQYPSHLSSTLTVIFGSLMIGNHEASSLSMPGKLRGTVKSLRIYKRLLPIAEIRQNAYNNCQTPSNTNAMVFWSPLNGLDPEYNSVKELVARQDGNLLGLSWQPFTGVYNNHRLVTTYQYNSLNQVVQQYSPDGDTTQFFYDRLGRLTVSQNKEQQTTASYSGTTNRFSYTKYDQLGRINEVGEKSNALGDIRNINMLDTTEVKNWMASGTNRQVTKTIYDEPVNSLQQLSSSRKRVTASIYLENATDTEGDSTLYVYDISGNVKTLIQHVKALVAADPTNGKKRMDYDYDLVSGKVNMVSYQQGKGDQFFYKYMYDADNRVTRSLTSRDKLVWTEDASYTYYLHGPLARTELGHYKVQGVDYAYTLQGWLKGINGDALNPSTEIANDGIGSSIYSRVSRDVYAFKLGYHSNDYKPIGGTGAPAFDQYTYTAPNSLDATGNQLFNGNISYTTLALSKFDSNSVRGYSYGYDQLNRLVEMRQHNVTGSWNNTSIITAYSESIAYDANGNILKYRRRGANTAGNPLEMDSLTYKYNRDVDGNLVNNKLTYVKDSVENSNYTVDIDNQSPGNYTYDRIGNLKKDAAEGIDTVRWTVYGKINRIVKGAASTTIDYGYDPGGNRTSKIVAAHDTITTTFYVRDAQGNVMGIYSKKNANPITWSEQDLYGSSRLGMWRWDTIVPVAPPIAGDNNPIQDSLMLGSRTYELSNHLGNVLSTISDKKIGHDSSGVVNYYIAEVLSQNDYYPGGMQMPNRLYNAGNYRYGFNGKEMDNEVKGEGNEIDYGMRVYDPRLMRFLSVDPLKKSYPFYSPYHFAGNSPIKNLDVDGAEPQDYLQNWHPMQMFTSNGLLSRGEMQRANDKLRITDYEAVYDDVTKQYWFITYDEGTDQHYYWKHKPGADPTHLIYSTTNPKNDNGSWQKFETRNKTEADKVNSDQTLGYIFGGMLILPGVLEGAAAIGFDYLVNKTVVAGTDAIGQYAATRKIDWADVALDYLPVKKAWLRASQKVLQSAVDISSDGIQVAGINKKWSAAAIDLGASYGMDKLTKGADKYVEGFTDELKSKVFKSYVEGQINMLKSTIQTRAGEKAKDVPEKMGIKF